MNYTYILILFAVGMLINIPMLRKPLSEDDGIWFYPAVFWNKGVRLYENFSSWAYGYFCVHWLSAKIYNTINTKNFKVFYCIKIIWYSLTAISIYFLTFCFWHNNILSLTAGLIFTIVTAVPNTLFMLTYGEHFYILPINLSIIFTYYGVFTGNPLFFLLAGLSSAWAFQIKPTALLYCILLPFSFYSTPKLLWATIIYITAFLVLNSIPLLIIKKINGNEHRHYLRGLITPILAVIKIFLNRLKIRIFDSLIIKLFRLLESRTVYIEKHYSKNFIIQWLQFKSYVLPATKDLLLILLLSTAQVFLLFINFDYFSFLIIVLFIIFLITQQLQKNYYTPHFNPCWAPISILAAKTVYDMWPYLINNGIYGWVVIAFLCYESIKITRIIARSFSKNMRDSFGHIDPLFSKVFRLCETIGKYIQENSNGNEKLFVWGDQPSIYLYARREAFDPIYLLIYAHQEKILKEKELLNSLRENPPELLIFYNYKVLDGWDIKRLQERIGIPYNFMKSFQVTDDSRKNDKNPLGICVDFPLYRRDDKRYKEILLDRSISAKINGELNVAQKHLENILEISPEDYEASIRLSLLKQNIAGSKTEQSYLEEKLAENHDSIKNAILLRLLAEIDVDTENLDSAVKYYEKALYSNPNDFRVYNGLGELSFSMDRIDDAFEYFKKAIVLHPYSSDVLNNIGVLLSQSGKRDDAIKYFQKALSFMPLHPDARKNMEALT